MKWEITYYSKALQEGILAFPVGIQARYIHLTERMYIYGANLGMPPTKELKIAISRMNEVKANADA